MKYCFLRTIVLTFDSLLGLDALYDPPRLMTSESQLDGPNGPSKAPKTTTKDAQPQVSATQTTASLTAAPDRLVTPTLDGPQASTALMETQTFALTTPSSLSGEGSTSLPDATEDSSSASVEDGANGTGTSGAGEIAVSLQVYGIVVLSLVLGFAV